MEYSTKQLTASELDAIFYPRPSATQYFSEFDRLIRTRLQALIAKGLVTIEEGRVAYKPLPVIKRKRRLQLDATAEHPNVVAFENARARAGNCDLKEQTWAAYRAMQKRYPGEPVRRLTGLPFCWVSENKSAALMAGNAEYFHTVKAIISDNILSFGILDYPEGWDYSAVRAWRNRTIVFTPAALRDMAGLVTTMEDSLRARAQATLERL